MTTDSPDKEARMLRLSILRREFLAGHPVNECVIQVIPLPGAPCKCLLKQGNRERGCDYSEIA